MSLIGKHLKLPVADGDVVYRVVQEGDELDGHRAPGGVVRLELIQGIQDGHGHTLIEKMNRILPGTAVAALAIDRDEDPFS